MVTPVAVKTSGAIKWNSQTIGGANNVRLTVGPQLVDVTSIGDSWVNRFPTISDWSVSFDLVYDVSDAGQAEISSSFWATTSSTFRYDLPGGKYLSGTAYIESMDFNEDAKEVFRASVSIKGDGALSYT